MIKVDLADIDNVYKELAKMQVPLDQNPLEYSPSRLSKKIAETRAFKSICEKFFNDFFYIQNSLNRGLRCKKTEYKLQRTNLLATDATVKAGKSVSERDALVDLQLKDLVAEIEEVESEIAELENILIVIKAKRSDLTDTQNRIKDQIKLCHDEIVYLNNKYENSEGKTSEERGDDVLGNMIDDLFEKNDNDIFD